MPTLSVSVKIFPISKRKVFSLSLILQLPDVAWPSGRFAEGKTGAFIMKVVDIGLSEIDAFSIQYARAF